MPSIAPDVADANRLFSLPDPTTRPHDLYVQDNGRFVRATNPDEILMFVDGSCLSNGYSNARAGYGVVFGPLDQFSGRLEQDRNPQTSGRAELRAVLASLTLRPWAREGVSRIVLACDSECVVKGITEWIFKWRTNKWRRVANQDLWKKLEEELREMERRGILVQFWKIPRDWNEADKYAKAGAVIIFFIYL